MKSSAIPVFRFDTEKTMAMMHRFMVALGEVSVKKLMKLLYLADKWHLNQYGRLISGDRYFAAPYGPIPSVTLAVLENKNRYVKQAVKIGAVESPADLKRIRDFFVVEEDSISNGANDCPYEGRLSSSDRMAIDHVLDEFGRLNEQQIVDYTHSLGEYKEVCSGGQIKYSSMMDCPTAESEASYRLHICSL